MARTEEIPEIRPIEHLFKKFEHSVVVAAGPNAKDDLDLFFKKHAHQFGTVVKPIIGVNHHADFHLIETDFNCFLDWPTDQTPEEFDIMASTPGKRVSIHEQWTDWEMKYKLNWVDRGETAMMAVWFASFITIGNVYLCGFDCWQNTEKSHFYKDRPEERKRLNGKPKRQKERWRELLLLCDNPKRIIPMSGILTEIEL